jgi:pimeloyl-ACP methyl ester carboxylesterase
MYQDAVDKALPVDRQQSLGIGDGYITMTVSPLWFGPHDRPLFGWLHAPSDGRARAGVVLCPSFAREDHKAHNAFQVLAERLVTQEIAVLRFDYDGMGDSAGSNLDSGRVGAWLRSTSDAIGLVRRFGVPRVSLVGMRIGATIAAHAAAQDGDIDQLVLWDPCLSGRAFLREQQMLSVLKLAAPTKRPDGSVETPGLLYGPDVVRDLRSLQLDLLGRPAARRVLVLTRPDRDPNPDLMARLGSEAVEHRESADQSLLMDVGPPLQRLPYDTVDSMVEWLAAGSTETASILVNPPEPRAAVVGYDSFGRSIIERPLFLPPIGLFGMLTEASGPSNDGPVAVFINVFDEHHIGPNRLWVELARQWASLGIRSVRVDLSGLGESPLRHLNQNRFMARAPEAFTDIADIAQAMSPADPRRIVLIGLCSSGYQAIDSALDLHSLGLVAINPVLRFVPPEAEQGLTLDPRRRAALPCKPATVALGGTAPMLALRRRFPGLRHRIRMWAQPDRKSSWFIERIMGLGWRARLRTRRVGRPSAWLEALVANGTDVLLVTGEQESRLIRFGTPKRLLGRLARSGMFRYEYIPDLEHSLLLSADRERVAQAVTAHMKARFSPESDSGSREGRIPSSSVASRRRRPDEQCEQTRPSTPSRLGV